MFGLYTIDPETLEENLQEVGQTVSGLVERLPSETQWAAPHQSEEFQCGPWVLQGAFSENGVIQHRIIRDLE